MINVANVLSFLVVVYIIIRYTANIVRQTLITRRVRLIKNRLILQQRLKNARMEYERANLMYLKSCEKKGQWVEDAEEILQQKIKQMREKQTEIIQELYNQYEIDKKRVEVLNKKNYIHDLLEVFSDHIRPREHFNHCLKIVGKLVQHAPKLE